MLRLLDDAFRAAGTLSLIAFRPRLRGAVSLERTSAPPPEPCRSRSQPCLYAQTSRASLAASPAIWRASGFVLTGVERDAS